MVFVVSWLKALGSRDEWTRNKRSRSEAVLHTLLHTVPPESCLWSRIPLKVNLLKEAGMHWNMHLNLSRQQLSWKKMLSIHVISHWWQGRREVENGGAALQTAWAVKQESRCHVGRHRMSDTSTTSQLLFETSSFHSFLYPISLYQRPISWPHVAICIHNHLLCSCGRHRFAPFFFLSSPSRSDHENTSVHAVMHEASRIWACAYIECILHSLTVIPIF